MGEGYVRVIGTPIGRLFLNSNSIKYEDEQIKLAYVERYLLLLSNKNVYITMCFGPYTKRDNKTEEALIQEWITLLGNKDETTLAGILKGIFWNDLTDVYNQESNECRTVQVGTTDLYVYL